MAPASRRQLSDLFKEHGSWDAVAQARPDLAGEVSEARQQGEQLARWFSRGEARWLEQHEKDRRKRQAVGEKRAKREAEEARLRGLQLEFAERALARDQVDTEGGGTTVDGRFDRWRIPLPSFWYILEQRVKRGKLAHVKTMSEHTRRSRKMPFVGRTRVKALVDWIDAHPEQAKHAWDVHETPASFRARGGGVLVPRS